MLTAKQEQFVKKLIEGMTQADAYRNAYDTSRMSDNAIYREASLLVENPKVAQRLAELREQLAKPSIMSAQERLEWLTEVVNSNKEDTNTKIRAIDTMNKMTGEYVTKVDGNLNVAKLEDLL